MKKQVPVKKKISATRGIYGFFSIFRKKLYEIPYRKKYIWNSLGLFVLYIVINLIFSLCSFSIKNTEKIWTIKKRTAVFVWFSVFLTKKSQVVPFAFLAKIRLFHNSVHFFIAVVDNFCYTERQNQNEMCLRGRQLSWRTEYQKGNRELFFCLKICRKKPSCIGGTCKKGAPFDDSGRIFVLFFSYSTISTPLSRKLSTSCW